MKLEKYLDYLGEFLNSYLEKSKQKGFVLGVSGGVDSAVVCGLLSKYCKGKFKCFILPIGKTHDLSDAINCCKNFDAPYEMIDLSNIYNSYLEVLPLNTAASANLKSRIRMATLYYHAQLNNFLVIGTDNACEFLTGYFTKFGDGGYDINPMRYLTKDEVYEAAKILGVNKEIINKKPSAGLVNNVCDEDELKVSYKEINNYINGIEISKESTDRIEYLHTISEHKRNLPVFPKKYKKR